MWGLGDGIGGRRTGKEEKVEIRRIWGRKMWDKRMKTSLGGEGDGG